MSIHLFELPTTGAVSFIDFVSDPQGAYTVELAEATQARANLRAALKESKRTDVKDYLRLVKVIDDYVPHLCGVLNCVDAGELQLRSEPIFSWRTTLSAKLFHASPRLSVPGLRADLLFTLLTSAFALTNLAHAVLVSLGDYETQRSILETERKEKDERLNFAVSLLGRAAGLFGWVGEVGLGEWEREVREKSGLGRLERPVELSREVCAALGKMSLADAQSLAIRKLLTKAAFESTLIPGPPLPKSHPSPALIAKLHLECAALYSSARALAKTPSSSKSKLSLSSKGKDKDRADGADDFGSGEVSPVLRHYLASEAALHAALAHKWLGVDAGERSAAGEAVGFLAWAKHELADAKDANASKHPSASDREKALREWRRARVVREAESVDAFLRGYGKMNDSVAFQDVPPRAELQARVPAGRLAVARKEWARPVPAFGPGSVEDARRRAEALEVGQGGEGVEGVTSPGSAGSYAGSGSYF
ncbi:hypothetical protein GLOTRDRAFT_137557 [Gloeophyllum trabeum ATCC 11539]|uniref:pH-response regulator protein palC n=1 Tax=Gloeophyllum trabeum (strain ATCC 11539 / FP-39264 / Madison 617) TaxID=670483 RepID=S7QCS8_GLOTA|nr:uncharacterized protein GLOTRDRAFT_137557 [Gloeophyllum trabeum ATCC 11539]EPQ57157.1 hypothetical protein GLOTRDRAFT_137557 [Gloeophyllum trabeum ATCC 11539]